VEDLIGYLEKRREFIPDYQERRRAGLWIASTRVEKFNDWAISGRCKHQGMSWTPQGVLALAAGTDRLRVTHPDRLKVTHLGLEDGHLGQGW
jgi:hypothetical protein